MIKVKNIFKLLFQIFFSQTCSLSATIKTSFILKVISLSVNFNQHDYYSYCFQISATFAASLVISPAVGAYMSHAYSLESVVALATLISLLDFFFIILFVPESLTKTTAAKPALSFDVFKTQEFFKVITLSLC